LIIIFPISPLPGHMQDWLVQPVTQVVSMLVYRQVVARAIRILPTMLVCLEEWDATSAIPPVRGPLLASPCPTQEDVMVPASRTKGQPVVIAIPPHWDLLLA
jgi:hypothetical protein